MCALRKSPFLFMTIPLHPPSYLSPPLKLRVFPSSRMVGGIRVTPGAIKVYFSLSSVVSEPSGLPAYGTRRSDTPSWAPVLPSFLLGSSDYSPLTMNRTSTLTPRFFHLCRKEDPALIGIRTCRRLLQQITPGVCTHLRFGKTPILSDLKFGR